MHWIVINWKIILGQFLKVPSIIHSHTKKTGSGFWLWVSYPYPKSRPSFFRVLMYVDYDKGHVFAYFYTVSIYCCWSSFSPCSKATNCTFGCFLGRPIFCNYVIIVLWLKHKFENWFWKFEHLFLKFKNLFVEIWMP